MCGGAFADLEPLRALAASGLESVCRLSGTRMCWGQLGPMALSAVPRPNQAHAVPAALPARWFLARQCQTPQIGKVTGGGRQGMLCYYNLEVLL